LRESTEITKIYIIWGGPGLVPTKATLRCDNIPGLVPCGKEHLKVNNAILECDGEYRSGYML